MLEMLEAMFFCNSIAKLASNMEITMLEMLEAIVFCNTIAKLAFHNPWGFQTGRHSQCWRCWRLFF